MPQAVITELEFSEYVGLKKDIKIIEEYLNHHTTANSLELIEDESLSEIAYVVKEFIEGDCAVDCEAVNDLRDELENQ